MDANKRDADRMRAVQMIADTAAAHRAARERYEALAAELDAARLALTKAGWAASDARRALAETYPPLRVTLLKIVKPTKAALKILAEQIGFPLLSLQRLMAGGYEDLPMESACRLSEMHPELMRDLFGRMGYSEGGNGLDN